MPLIPIYAREVQGHNQSVILVDADTPYAALHKAAERAIKEYAMAGIQYGTREIDWLGYPWPSLMITVTIGGKEEDLDELTACKLWATASDMELLK